MCPFSSDALSGAVHGNSPNTAQTPDQAPPTTPATPLLSVSEADIRRLVHRFYAKVRHDAELGPIFNARVQDWDHHLEMLCDFWSALVLGTRRFKGAPIPAHARLPDLSWALFQRWLALFHETTAETDCPALQEQADMLSERIAAKLWQVWQSRQAQQPARLPDALPDGVVPYKSSPMFTPDNLPDALRNTHATRAGTWGLLHVHTGLLRFSLDESARAGEWVLAAGQRVLIEPEVRHHVSFELPGSFQITFARAAELA